MHVGLLHPPAVVDAKHILLHLDEEKPDGVINESIQQVGSMLLWPGRRVGGLPARLVFCRW